jgi:hypothetical protein
MTNAQLVLTPRSTARPTFGLWARAVARRALESPQVDVTPVVRETSAAPVQPLVAEPKSPEEMYAELALRTSTLLEHQHALLDSLERDETDPGRLDQLFALDHLIAQSRRYADSLRVLAGETSLRAPEVLSLDDVLHAAASSVQDYPRVRIHATVAQLVTAAASVDVIQLVTESLDQALAAAGGAVVSVVTAREGESLRIGIHHPTLTPTAPSATAVHLVEQLAARHGIHVERLTGSQGESVVCLTLPPSALAAAPEVAETSETTENDEWRAPVVALAEESECGSPRHRRDDDSHHELARRSG